MLIATLDLRRFAAFFAINVALLTGYLTIIIYYAVRFIINYVTSRSNEYVSSQLLGFIGLKAPITYKSSETSTKFDYYEVLGIPRNAIHKQIKKAHRDLVSKYQIGITLTDNDRERLRIIDGAYAVLSDHHKRAIYDRSESNMAMKEKYGTKARKRVGFQAGNGINITVAGLVIFLLVFFPNFNEIPTIINYTTQQQAPNDAWSNSLSWLKDNTPEPFGDAAFYYASYQTPFLYPDTAYSVAAWWDYGYWILRIAHRLPSCDPGGGNRASVANLFTAQSETAANEEANKLNSKYIIIDDATVTTKFYAVAIYEGTNPEQFTEVFYRSAGGKMIPEVYYYPDYYRSLAVRLYFFDGKEATYNGTTIISYAERVNQDGLLYKEIIGTQSFPTFEQAVEYISKKSSGNYKIASPNPMITPIPLTSLESYNLVYSSSQSAQANSNVPALKIFEYVPQ